MILHLKRPTWPAVKAFAAHWWDEILCGLILLILALFLLGVDVGINGYVSIVLAAVGGLVLPVILFFVATLILPLLAFMGAIVAALVAVVTGLFTLLLAPVFTFLMSAVIVPVAAFFTGLASSLLAWLATTWLGTLLAPLINVVTPLLLKVGPWLTVTRNGTWLYNRLKGVPFVAAIGAAWFAARKKYGPRKAPAKKKAASTRPAKRHPRRR
jgi:hypothetical protein